MTKAERIKRLGDVSDLIDTYLKENKEKIRVYDFWNPAGFTEQHIDSDFGWGFKLLPKPSLEKLEELWQRTDWTPAEWNKMSILERFKDGYFG